MEVDENVIVDELTKKKVGTWKRLAIFFFDSILMAGACIGLFYSLGTNYAFLTNVLRKSIYEYYVGQKYILTNQRKATNLFEKKLQTKSDDFELLQLDMIISSIETKWVENA